MQRQSTSPPGQVTSPMDNFMASLPQVSASASPKEYITVITPSGERLFYRRPSLRSAQTVAAGANGQANAEVNLDAMMRAAAGSGVGAQQQGTFDSSLMPGLQDLTANQTKASNDTSPASISALPEYDANAFAAFFAGSDSLFDLDIPVSGALSTPILNNNSSLKDSISSDPTTTSQQQYPTPTDEDAPPPPHNQAQRRRAAEMALTVAGPPIQRSVSATAVPTKRPASELNDGPGDSRKQQRTARSKQTSTFAYPSNLGDSDSLRSPTHSPGGRPLLHLSQPSRTRSAPPTPPSSRLDPPLGDNQVLPSTRYDPATSVAPMTPTLPPTAVTEAPGSSKFCLPDVDFFMKRVQDGKDSKNPAKISCALVDNMVDVMNRTVNQTTPRPNPPWNIFNASKPNTAEGRAIQRARALLAKVLIEEGIDGAQETYKAFQLMAFSEMGQKLRSDLSQSELLKGRGLRAGDLISHAQ